MNEVISQSTVQSTWVYLLGLGEPVSSFIEALQLITDKARELNL